MQRIKVVWRDTQAHEGKVYTYRGHAITGYRLGWITDMPGDDNIYQTRISARNAIDLALGDKRKKRDAGKRAEQGIQIIGKKSEKAGVTI